MPSALKRIQSFQLQILPPGSGRVPRLPLALPWMDGRMGRTGWMLDVMLCCWSHLRRFLLRFESPAPDSGLATLEEATMQIVSWQGTCVSLVKGPPKNENSLRNHGPGPHLLVASRCQNWWRKLLGHWLPSGELPWRGPWRELHRLTCHEISWTVLSNQRTQGIFEGLSFYPKLIIACLETITPRRCKQFAEVEHLRGSTFWRARAVHIFHLGSTSCWYWDAQRLKCDRGNPR